GALQSALDTLSYLILDTQAIGDPQYPDQGALFVRDIRALGTDAFAESNVSLWQELLETRASMLQEIYMHPKNKMAEEARRQLLRIAMARGYITPEELMSKGDHELQMRLQSS